jgi:hypothetical protein
MNIELEQTFKQLAAQFVEKQAELTVLKSQQKASALRLDDVLRREAETQATLRNILGEVDKARKGLAQAKRDAAKIRADAEADADRIRQQSRDEAEGFLQGVQSAVAAAASVIKKHKETK